MKNLLVLSSLILPLLKKEKGSPARAASTSLKFKKRFFDLNGYHLDDLATEITNRYLGVLLHAPSTPEFQRLPIYHPDHLSTIAPNLPNSFIKMTQVDGQEYKLLCLVELDQNPETLIYIENQLDDLLVNPTLIWQGIVAQLVRYITDKSSLSTASSRLASLLQLKGPRTPEIQKKLTILFQNNQFQQLFEKEVKNTVWHELIHAAEPFKKKKREFSTPANEAEFSTPANENYYRSYAERHTMADTIVNDLLAYEHDPDIVSLIIKNNDIVGLLTLSITLEGALLSSQKGYAVIKYILHKEKMGTDSNWYREDSIDFFNKHHPMANTPALNYYLQAIQTAFRDKNLI